MVLKKYTQEQQVIDTFAKLEGMLLLATCIIL